MSFNEKLIMEKELNIAAILKDKPQGTKLYDWLHNIDVELDTISTTDTETVVWCTNETNNNTTYHRAFSKLGTMRGCLDGLQILLPSKEMRDWCKFSWKKGDILVNDDKDVHIIFEAFENDTYTRFKGKHYLWKEGNEEDYCKEETFLLTSVFEKVNDDAVKCYINTVEERLGGKLNQETLEIEKQPEFKDGDILYMNGSRLIYIFKKKVQKSAATLYYASLDADYNSLYYNNAMEDVHGSRLATDSEKQQLFSALEKKGKRWDAENKQIVDLPKKCEFKPFDKVLVRDSNDHEWKAGIFSHYSEGVNYPFICIGCGYGYCIPYNEETKHLLGTADEWKGGK